MKVWIKLTKHFQGGSKSTYKLVDSSDIATEDQEQELMEVWGENSDGGHSYGYRVDMERLPEGEFPPKEWLEREVRNREVEIEYLKKSIANDEKLIEEYERLFKLL